MKIKQSQVISDLISITEIDYNKFDQIYIKLEALNYILVYF